MTNVAVPFVVLGLLFTRLLFDDKRVCCTICIFRVVILTRSQLHAQDTQRRAFSCQSAHRECDGTECCPQVTSWCIALFWRSKELPLLQWFKCSLPNSMDFTKNLAHGDIPKSQSQSYSIPWSPCVKLFVLFTACHLPFLTSPLRFTALPLGQHSCGLKGIPCKICRIGEDNFSQGSAAAKGTSLN